MREANEILGVLLVLLTAGSWLASAQTWDTSGNGMLNGTYYFRQVIYLVQDEYGELGEATAIYRHHRFQRGRDLHRQYNDFR